MGAPRQNKACWACRSKFRHLLYHFISKAEFSADSKVRCTLSIPICSNCFRTGKNCQYGLRLSWPREGDARRSMVLGGKYLIPLAKSNIEPHFLNVGHVDTTLGFIIASHMPATTHELFQNSLMSQFEATPKSIPRSLRWAASKGGEFENTLLSLCKDGAPKSKG
jgi:Fungal Zn(2)-Cys(6) binuclear cluster domain